MLPDVGSLRRLIMRSRVDLPEPDCPMTPTSCPAGTTSEMPSTARLDPKLLITLSSRNMSEAVAAPRCTNATVRLRNQDARGKLSQSVEADANPQNNGGNQLLVGDRNIGRRLAAFQRLDHVPIAEQAEDHQWDGEAQALVVRRHDEQAVENQR